MTGQDHQVTPSASVVAHDLERQLREIVNALASVEGHFTQHGNTSHSDAIAVAREHIQAAIAALELASRD